MATKTLPKHTKNELITMLNELGDKHHRLQAAHAQALNDVTRLKEDLHRLESRRRYESLAYQTKRRTPRASRTSFGESLDRIDHASRARTPTHGELSQRYCAEHGVKSVSIDTLNRWARDLGYSL